MGLGRVTIEPGDTFTDMVADNDGLTAYEEAPTTQKWAFGSSKESSFARQGKHLGIEESLITKYVYPKISAEYKGKQSWTSNRGYRLGGDIRQPCLQE